MNNPNVPTMPADALRHCRLFAWNSCAARPTPCIAPRHAHNCPSHSETAPDPTRRAFLLRIIPAALCACALASCGTPARRKDGSHLSSDFDLSLLAKTDIDMVAEVHFQETYANLRTLMEKLYRRNPKEWRKTGQPSGDAIVSLVFDTPHDWRFKELDNKKGTDAIQLAFREDYQGDRVLAFIVGLATMNLIAYNDKSKFFALDELSPQKLYNSARNVEIAAWKLANSRDAKGDLYLLSNAIDGSVRNLSFEREFGKIIAHQDTLARIVAEKTNRIIVRVIQTMATAAFLPM